MTTMCRSCPCTRWQAADRDVDKTKIEEDRHENLGRLFYHRARGGSETIRLWLRRETYRLPMRLDRHSRSPWKHDCARPMNSTEKSSQRPHLPMRASSCVKHSPACCGASSFIFIRWISRLAVTFYHRTARNESRSVIRNGFISKAPIFSRCRTSGVSLV
jgi:hypothetical protein